MQGIGGVAVGITPNFIGASFVHQLRTGVMVEAHGVVGGVFNFTKVMFAAGIIARVVVLHVILGGVFYSLHHPGNGFALGVFLCMTATAGLTVIKMLAGFIFYDPIIRVAAVAAKGDHTLPTFTLGAVFFEHVACGGGLGDFN